MNLDVGHAAVTDPDPAATIRELGSAIVHLHLEDIRERVHRHLFFGEGDIDFAGGARGAGRDRLRGTLRRRPLRLRRRSDRRPRAVARRDARAVLRETLFRTI